jgi:hypothetical protein
LEEQGETEETQVYVKAQKQQSCKLNGFLSILSFKILAAELLVLLFDIFIICLMLLFCLYI